MSNLVRAIIAGFTATAVMSILMVIKTHLGLYPDLNVIGTIDGINNTYVGAPDTVWSGWIAHFCIGSIIYGVLFWIVNPRLTGSNVFNGIILGLFAWLAMMLIIMPLAGAGFFGLAIGEIAPIGTLVLHAVYGAVLGFSYGKLGGS